MTQKAVLYVRVSSEEQETNTSLDSQEKTGRQYAEKNGLDIVKLWRGPESAWRNDTKDDGDRIRKNFNEMLDFVADNKIKHLIFDVPDRLTRNEDDKIRIRKLIKHDGITVHFARTNKILHKYSDSDEFFMFGIEVLMAEKYSADLSKRIRKGMDATVAMGRFPAIAPMGYTNNPVTKILDVDPVRAPFVQMAFRLKAYENKSIDEITEILYRKGLRSRKLGTKFPGNMKFVTSRVHKMLRDSFYYGEFKWNGNTYKGAYEPLISK
ncbi:MAG: recombinase family protein [Spirochaetia bacterium]|nr:recombinase family protein [Spirochaetia bacterium]